jgi:hypothetical protein
MRALLSHLFHWSVRAQTATVVAGPSVQGAAMANVRLSARDQPSTVVAGTNVDGAN